MNNLKEKLIKIEDIIKNSKKIGIISHMNPDGDNLGSLTAVYNTFKLIGLDVLAFQLDEIPEYLKFLPCLDELSYCDDIKDIDTLITLDCASPELLGNAKQSLKYINNIINIDHHKSNSLYGNINIVEPNISSTCELVYKILKTYNLKIARDTATSLFTGICTDTGRFLYSSTTQDTFMTISKLIDYGAEKDLIMQKLFQSGNLNAKKLSNVILSNSIFRKSNKIVISIVTNNLLDKYQLKLTDLTDIINYYRDTKEVEVSCFIKEQPDGSFKVSFRSKNLIDVSVIANDFGGGGHFSAAACQISGNLEDVKTKLIKRLDAIEW